MLSASGVAMEIAHDRTELDRFIHATAEYDSSVLCWKVRRDLPALRGYSLIPGNRTESGVHGHEHLACVKSAYRHRHEWTNR
jgi:hypothetical protein